jgi:tRNA nucleotidyltransferase (CCA-adding enzyme)
MDMKHRVVLSYLSEFTASVAIPEDMKSKEDPAKQTQAVEKLIKDVITQKLPEYSDKVFSVGGFVRDVALGKNPKDIDIVVDDPNDKMKSAEIFAKKFTDALGITTGNNPHPLKDAYGIWGVVLFNPKAQGGHREPFVYEGTDITGYVVELTPPRKEGPYDFKKREPQYVEYTPREQDAKRRDLTINALYKNIVTGKIEDHVGGLNDLRAGTLRPPAHPEGIRKIYEEDPLRVLRLIRFKGKLPGFKVSPETEQTVKAFLSSSEGQKAMKDKLSVERIRDEFQQILMHPNPKAAVDGMETLREFGLLKYISQELDKLFDVYHDSVFHKGESVWQHTMEVLERTPPTLKARLGALFHDIGKLETMEQDTDSEGRTRVHFKGHEDVSARMADKILRDLKFPSDVAKSVQNIVHSHMGFKNIGDQKDKTQMKHMRIFIEKIRDDLDDAIALMKADAVDDPIELQQIQALESKLKHLREEDTKKGLLVDKGKGPEYVHPITGEELMEEYKNLQGEALGAVKNRLKQMLMEGQFEGLDDKQRAEKAKKLVRTLALSEEQLAAVVDKYSKGKKSKPFFSVR